jgi:hypothetical protein
MNIQTEHERIIYLYIPNYPPKTENDIIKNIEVMFLSD